MENAAYYRIYLYNAENGKHQRIGQTSKLSFSAGELSARSEYTFLVRAFYEDGAGSLWTLADNQSIVTAPEAPRLSCAKRYADKLDLTWNAVEGARFYRLYLQDTQTEKFTRLAQTEQTAYTLPSLDSGTAYVLLVRAFAAGNSASDYGEENYLQAVTLPAAPQFSLKAFSYSVRLSWEPVRGASLYRVYSFDTSTKKYTKLIETQECRWEHFGLNGNTEYTYLVRANDEAGGGSPYTKADNLSIKTCLNKPKFTLAAKSESAINISWKKVSGAAYYRIYLYDGNSGKYTRVAQTTALSYVYSGAALGREYSFLVRAFTAAGEGSSYSVNNNKSLVLELKKPAFSLTASKKGSVTITWQAVPLAAYYRIYSFDAESGKYSRLAQTKSLSYTCAALESGKEYSFLVRAFMASGKASDYTVEDNILVTIL